jgi:uncharacterized protein (TIGR04222 family)
MDPFELSNPLDLRGPQFLLLYLVVLGIAIIVALILRRRLRSPHDEPLMKGMELDPYETAYLTSDRYPVDAAIGMLVKREAININPQTGALSVKSRLPENSHPFERAAYAMMAGGPTINDVRKALIPHVAALGAKPKARGLVISDEQSLVARIVPALVILMVGAFGALKILVGVMRDRPVTFLVVLCILTGIIALLFFKAVPRLTGAGEKYLRNLRRQKAALETTARTRPDLLAGPDLALAMGLFGLGALGAGYGPREDLRTAMRAQASSGGSSSSCSSGSSGCSSGGCGGGGCGGCGS